MTNERAKELLSGVRSEEEADVRERELLEAMKVAAEDEEVGAWLEEERAFDDAFRGKLREVPVPADLEGKLLELGERRGKIVSFPVRRVLLAVAAVLVLAAVPVKLLLFPAPVEFPAADYASAEVFRAHMAYFAGERFMLDKWTDDLVEARDWLVADGSPAYPDVPAAIAGMEGMGCKSIDWGGRRVGLVCFVNDGGEIVHLFVAEREGFGGDVELPQLVSHELNTAGWSDERFVYVLVGSEPGVEVDEFLPVQQA